jgi:hypothetical protein
MGCVGLGGDSKVSLHSTITIQGMVIAPVNGKHKQFHQEFGLVLVKTRLAHPYEVRRVDVDRPGCAVYLAYFEMCRIVADAVYELITAIEPMNNIDDAGSELTRKVGKLGSQTVDNKEAQYWF